MPENVKNNDSSEDKAKEPKDQGLEGEVVGSEPTGVTREILDGIENRDVETTMEEYFTGC